MLQYAYHHNDNYYFVYYCLDNIFIREQLGNYIIKCIEVSELTTAVDLVWYVNNKLRPSGHNLTKERKSMQPQFQRDRQTIIACSRAYDHIWSLNIYHEIMNNNIYISHNKFNYILTLVKLYCYEYNYIFVTWFQKKDCQNICELIGEQTTVKNSQTCQFTVGIHA